MFKWVFFSLHSCTITTETALFGKKVVFFGNNFKPLFFQIGILLQGKKPLFSSNLRQTVSLERQFVSPVYVSLSNRETICFSCICFCLSVVIVNVIKNCIFIINLKSSWYEKKYYCYDISKIYMIFLFRRRCGSRVWFITYPFIWFYKKTYVCDRQTSNDQRNHFINQRSRFTSSQCSW